jgi:hypothetical protein
VSRMGRTSRLWCVRVQLELLAAAAGGPAITARTGLPLEVSGWQEGIALAVKMSSGPARDAAGQLCAIVGHAHAPAGRLGWFSYGGTARVVLAVVLVAAATGVAGAGLRLRVPVHLPRPGRTARTAVLATWGLLIVAYLICLGFLCAPADSAAPGPLQAAVTDPPDYRRGHGRPVLRDLVHGPLAER